MIQKIIDKKYRFASIFNSKTGFYVRTGIIDHEGKDTGVDPFMASFPHLIDVGIMGSCSHGKTGLCKSAGIECYQDGSNISKKNMDVEDFRSIAQQCNGKVNQIALGGRGDPNEHERFEEILKICKENNIVPNFTTSGYLLNSAKAALCKKYCGAVAVSWYRSEHTINAINLLIDNGVKTNIHYVLGRNSIDEAIDRLERNDFPKGINAVIFLLHKPVGMGSHGNVISPNDRKLQRFFNLIESSSNSFKIGMDSCTVPGVINYFLSPRIEVLDTCEGARFSCYISSDMMMTPCSFDQTERYASSLKNMYIQEVWEGIEFEEFRMKMRNSCPNCTDKNSCKGGCPILPEIVLCSREERSIGGQS